MNMTLRAMVCQITGDDTIIVFATGQVDRIWGDGDDTTGNKGGNDSITVYGTADWVFGDQLLSETTGKRGGDDTIDIYGTVTGSVIGDSIKPYTNYIDHGGDDFITIHADGTVNHIFGDSMRSINGSSTGGNDRIIVAGTVVFDITGDLLVNGKGGADDIVVLSNGEVGGSIYGDGMESDTGINGNDKISIFGKVDGNVEGDG